MQFPETPESVALVLLAFILTAMAPTAANTQPSARILDLYAECLAAVSGERPAAARH